MPVTHAATSPPATVSNVIDNLFAHQAPWGSAALARTAGAAAAEEPEEGAGGTCAAAAPEPAVAPACAVARIMAARTFALGGAFAPPLLLARRAVEPMGSEEEAKRKPKRSILNVDKKGGGGVTCFF